MVEDEVDGEVGGDLFTEPDGFDVFFFDDGLQDSEVGFGEFDGGDDEDLAGIQEEVGQLAKAADVLAPVVDGIATLEVGVDAVEDGADAEVVAEFAIFEELALEEAGEAFAADAFGAGDDDEGGFLVVFFVALLHGDVAADPFLVTEADLITQLADFVGEGFEDDATAADFIFIDEHEAAGIGEFVGGVEGDGMGEAQGNFGDVVMLDLEGVAPVLGAVVAGVDDFVDGFDLGFFAGGAEFEDEGFGGGEGVVP